MFKFKIFHTPRPRQYTHKPIYWDPEEEECREREKRVARDMGQGNPDIPYHTDIKRGTFRRRHWDAPQETHDMRRERRRSNVRLAIIAIVLLALTALLYFIRR